MAYRFNPAPGWPAPPEGWTPPEGWQPDPAWPPAPEGWEFWVWQDDAPAMPTTGEPAADPVVEAPLSRRDPGAEPEAPLGTPEHPEAPFSAHDANAEPQPGQGDGEHLQAPFSGEGFEESDAPPVEAAPAQEPEQAPERTPVSGSQQGEPHAPFSQQDREAEPPADPGTGEHPQAVFSTDEDAREEPELGQGVAGQPQDSSEPAPAPTPPPAVFPPGASGTGQESPQPYAEQPAADHGWGQPGGQPPTPVDPAQHQPPQPYAQQGHQGPQHTTPQQSVQQHRPSAHAASESAPKKGKGMLVALIIVAVILAIAFVWALVSFLSGDSSANAAAAPVLQAMANAPPTYAG